MGFKRLLRKKLSVRCIIWTTYGFLFSTFGPLFAVAARLLVVGFDLVAVDVPFPNFFFLVGSLCNLAFFGDRGRSNSSPEESAACCCSWGSALRGLQERRLFIKFVLKIYCFSTYVSFVCVVSRSRRPLERLVRDGDSILPKSSANSLMTLSSLLSISEHSPCMWRIMCE